MIGVAAVETKNYVIATSTEHFEYVAAQDRFASDSDYLLYRLNCLVFHLNHCSTVFELDDVILTTVRKATNECSCDHGNAIAILASSTVVRITSSNSNTGE